MEGLELFDMDGADNFDRTRYTNVVPKIQYKPKSKYVPELESCVNTKKYKELLKEIEASDCDESIKEFLRLSATRHILFDYENIAEYYCHADKETQCLMEKSGLVIIDIEDAMENGFLKLQKNLEELYDEAVKK